MLLSSTARISSPRVSVTVKVSAMISMLFFTISLDSELLPALALVTVTDFSARSSRPAEEGEELICDENNNLDQDQTRHHITTQLQSINLLSVEIVHHEGCPIYLGSISDS